MVALTELDKLWSCMHTDASPRTHGAQHLNIQRYVPRNSEMASHITTEVCLCKAIDYSSHPFGAQKNRAKLSSTGAILSSTQPLCRTWHSSLTRAEIRSVCAWGNWHTSATSFFAFSSPYFPVCQTPSMYTKSNPDRSKLLADVKMSDACDDLEYKRHALEYER